MVLFTHLPADGVNDTTPAHRPFWGHSVLFKFRKACFLPEKLWIIDKMNRSIAAARELQDRKGEE